MRSRWTCCGASSAHQTDRELAASLASANLVKAGRMGMDMVVNCAACYNRSKVANYEMVHSEDMRRAVAESLGEPYDGSVPVRHFVEILLKDVGVAALRKKITSPLTGLKAAAYYGCYLVRPPEATNFDDPENPTILERLIEVTGAENVEWSGKVECCGGMQNLTRTEITVRRSAAVIDMARAAGAECIVVACPMCQISPRCEAGRHGEAPRAGNTICSSVYPYTASRSRARHVTPGTRVRQAHGGSRQPC